MNKRKANSKKPDFLCIGFEKSGTTWLYRNLSNHKNIYLPPFKEIFFLAEGAVVPKSNLFKKLFNKNWYFTYIRNKMLTNFLNYRNIVDSKSDLFWGFRFFFLPRNFQWYSSLFNHCNKTSGDITPSYCLLPEEKVKIINNHFPDLKIVIILRNQVDRVWSKAKMDLLKKRNRNISEVSEQEFFHFFKTVNNKNNYIETINLWSKYFNKIFIGFFDEIINDPITFMVKICRFLDVEFDESDQFTRNLNKPVFKGLDFKIPDKFNKFLANQYVRETIALNNLYPDNRYLANWLKMQNDIIRK